VAAKPILTAEFEREFHDIIKSVSSNDTSLLIGGTGGPGGPGTTTGLPGVIGAPPSADTVIEMELYLQWSASNPNVLLG